MKAGVLPRAYRASTPVNPTTDGLNGRRRYNLSSVTYESLASAALSECDDSEERAREMALRDGFDRWSGRKSVVKRNSSSQGLASKL